MSEIKVIKNKNYSVMSNYHLQDKKLSLKAKGLMSLMLSLPENWDYSIKGLATLSKDGKDSVMNILKELEEKNYLSRIQKTNEKGQFCGCEYLLYEKPYTENPNTENPTQINDIIINNNILLNNKILNNKYSNEINEIVNYLNEKTNKHYQTKGATYEIIEARLKDKYTVDDCKHVIDVKCQQWLNTDMEKYIRPETLFNRTKFESYVNEKLSNYTGNNYDISNDYEEL